MTTIVQIRDELANVIDGISGWRANAFWGETVNPPVVKISRPPFDPRMVFSAAKQEAVFRATAYVAAGTGESGERQLEALAELTGAGSLTAIVQTGSNWSISIDFAQVVMIGQVIPEIDSGVGSSVLAFDIKVVW